MQSVNNGAIEERESMSNMTDQMGVWPQLRPGAELLEISEDKLHISFANYTVTFTTPVVTGVVKDLLAAMEHGGCQDEVINRVATHGNLEPGLVSYVFEMLVSSHCLYWSDPKGTSKTGNDALGDFFASIGEDPEPPKRVLAAARPLVLTSDASERILAEGFSASGICAEVVHFVLGTPIACVADQIKQRLTSDISMIVSWDLPYRSPAARIINEIAMSGVPVLFGACEGLIGRIGPYVLPRSTPCLECLNSRLLTHGGAEEFSFVTNYRLLPQHVVQASRPTHPVFLRAVAGFFVLELTQILLKRPPRTLGGMIEYDFMDGSAVHRRLLKVPRCPACLVAKPPRFAWNTVFFSSVVKE